MKKRAIELFAGVGGFRIGLNEVTLSKKGKAVEKNNFQFIWANQWEPSTTSQDAFNCYKFRFSNENSHDSEFSNENINKVDKTKIGDFELLTGGFPCQDYSVARTLNNEKGIKGKKGVLWWDIYDILQIKTPPFVLLENVDRLLKSPSKQRGRDFGIMLKCFSNLGYFVEWRVINASEYGMPQRRRRLYIFAFNKKTEHFKKMIKYNEEDVFLRQGIFAKTFSLDKIDDIYKSDLSIYKDYYDVTNNFKFNFNNSGYMLNDNIYTCKSYPKLKPPVKLSDILVDNCLDKTYYLTDEQIVKFRYLKGSKKLKRIASNGYEYIYSEGAMAFPDAIDEPARTMLTSEGSVNRSTHIVQDKKTHKLRFLLPIECERLNQFPDNWTDTMSDKRRHFVMGNALVTGIIKKLGKEIINIIECENLKSCE